MLELKIIDEIIPEPLGGAHRDKSQILENVKNIISKNIKNFDEMSAEDIINDRKNKFLKIGRHKGFISNIEDLSTLEIKTNYYEKFLESKKLKILTLSIFLLSFLFFIYSYLL